MRNVAGSPLGWIPVLLALAATAWVLWMPFQADDYLLLPATGALLGFEDPAPVDDPRPDAHIENFYLFRPVPWFIWWLLMEAGGGLSHPALFHAAGMAFHALAAWLLYRVLRGPFAPFPAMAGASLFAIAPGAVQAVSYVAAWGDQLSVVWMLAAALLLQRYRRRPASWTAALAAVAVGLAFLSKDVAVASLPALFLAAWATPGDPRPRWWRPIAAIAAVLALAYAARAIYLGTWRPAYLGAAAVGIESLRHLLGLVFELIAPWRDCRGVEDLAPVAAKLARRAFRGNAGPGLHAIAAAFFCLPLVAGLLRRPFRVGVRIAACGVALACALAPALVIYPSPQIVSRALYAASAVAVAAIAGAIEPRCATGRGRWFAVALLVPLAALWADLMRHVARTELRAGAMVDARLDSMRDLASTLPKDARVMALDDQFELGCIPLIYFGIGNAMKPPFVPAGLPRVLWWESMETLPRGGILDEHPGPIVIARLSEGRYVERHPRIPGLPGSLPSLAAVPDEPGTWRFAAPIPARAVAAVVVAAGSAGTFECTWIGSRGKRATRGALPGLGGDPRAIVSAPRDFDWLADPVLLGVQLEGVEARSVDPLAELPEIRIAAPAALARIPVGLPDVAFELPSQARSDEYRLTIEFAFSQDERPLMIWEEPAGALTTLPNGTVTFGARQRAPSFVAGKPMDAEAFGARLHAVLAASGAGVVPISLRVEGFDPRSGSIQCRSSWRNCFLERRD